MAEGLSVLLEPHSKSHRGGKAVAAQIISKATLVIHGHRNHKQQQQHVPISPTAAGSSFLQRCCLCRRELAEGTDIYMYRGDRPFCSEECRCRQIFMDEEAASSCGNGASAGAGAATVRGSRRVAGRGSVAY